MNIETKEIKELVTNFKINHAENQDETILDMVFKLCDKYDESIRENFDLRFQIKLLESFSNQEKDKNIELEKQVKDLKASNLEISLNYLKLIADKESEIIKLKGLLEKKNKKRNNRKGTSNSK